MNNAAKAMLVAGGILVSMLVITVSIYLKNRFVEAAEDSYRLQHVYQINAFNLFFTKYGPIITGADAYNILSRVEEVNSGSFNNLIEVIDSQGNLNVNNYKDYFYYTERLLDNNITYEYKFDYEVFNGIGDGVVARVILNTGVEKIVIGD